MSKSFNGHTYQTIKYNDLEDDLGDTESEKKTLSSAGEHIYVKAAKSFQ